MKRKRKKQSSIVQMFNNMSVTRFFLVLIPVLIIAIGIPLIVTSFVDNEPPEPAPSELCDICDEDPCICPPSELEPAPEPQPEPEPESSETIDTPTACDVCNEYPCICEESEEPIEPEEIIDTGFYNPLTGMPTREDISNNRPIAVMINNVRAGLPQHGTSRADIIYETLVEGAATRTVALFQDVSNVGVIGSVRSARTFFIDVVQGHDAIYLHAGGSPEAIELLRTRSIDGFNHVTVFYRDPGRRGTHAYEHTLMTSGDRITRGLANSRFRLEHESNFELPLVFAEELTSPPNGSPANRVVVTFSAGKTTTFVFSQERNRYLIEQFGRAHVDANDGTQLTAANVIVIRTAIRVADDAGRQDITTIGRGSGYLATNGEFVEINWIRERQNQPFRFTFADGSPVVLNRGTTYICVIPTGQTVTFE